MDGRNCKTRTRVKRMERPLKISVVPQILGQLKDVGNITLMARSSGEDKRVTVRLLGMRAESSGRNTGKIPVRLPPSDVDALMKGRTVTFTDGKRDVTFSVDTIESRHSAQSMTEGLRH